MLTDQHPVPLIAVHPWQQLNTAYSQSIVDASAAGISTVTILHPPAPMGFQINRPTKQVAIFQCPCSKTRLDLYKEEIQDGSLICIGVKSILIFFCSTSSHLPKWPIPNFLCTESGWNAFEGRQINEMSSFGVSPRGVLFSFYLHFLVLFQWHLEVLRWFLWW